VPQPARGGRYFWEDCVVSQPPEGP
jgi:hypothetical protein